MKKLEFLSAYAGEHLRLEGITKIYNEGQLDESRVFDGFDISVPRGEFVSIVGSNGSGKTTLLNLVSGTILPNAGKVILFGQPQSMEQDATHGGEDITRIPEFRRALRIGRVFQNPSLGTAPDMTIDENFALADCKGKFASLAPGLNRRRLEFYRENVSSLGLGLEDKMDIRVGALSGGQRQALALLMTTLADPEILLLDEHTAALDPKTSEIIMELTDQIVRKKKMTALMVTHNLKFAVNFGSRILMMDKGRAVVDKCGSEKKSVGIDTLLKIFNEISIECGN